MYIRALHAVDGYKTGHIYQFPPKTQYVYSNFTCRSDKHFGGLPDFDHKVVFFGLQGVCQWLLIKLWNDTFFHQPKDEVVSYYRRRMDNYLGVGSVGMDHIEALHDLGYLPVKIKALPEGSRVDIRVPLYTIVNTHPDFYWVTNYLETQLSAELWLPTTTATKAFEYRRLFEKYADLTGVDKSIVDYYGHDFSARGMEGIFSGQVSGAAHLLSFAGTDTVAAIDYLEDYYDGLTGKSVPATEHAVMCMGGEENELETFRRLITEVYPSGIVSIVSDSWDFWKVITEYARILKPEIMNRDGKVVFRPDSGDPVKIIAGDSYASKGSPEYKGAVQCLWDIFGGTYTSTGHRTLDPHVGTIYGDSISLEVGDNTLYRLSNNNFSFANEVYGIGSFSYQFVTRDTLGTAIKATWGVVDGKPREICKDPKTDSGLKKSAKGLLRVEFEHGHYVLYDQQTPEQEQQGLLETVFENGKLVKFQTLDEIRDRLLSRVY
jgi:nicotinamide phosphoribosyltransferase